ncbi:hypothetical protein RUND412_010442 [Rhizina undulata]
MPSWKRYLTEQEKARYKENMKPPAFLEEYYQCAICLDVYIHPVLLPCGHTFCRECLLKTFECVDTPEHCRCPMCRFSPAMYAKRHRKVAKSLNIYRYVWNVEIPKGREQEFSKVSIRGSDLDVSKLFKKLWNQLPAQIQENQTVIRRFTASPFFSAAAEEAPAFFRELNSGRWDFSQVYLAEVTRRQLGLVRMATGQVNAVMSQVASIRLDDDDVD